MTATATAFARQSAREDAKARNLRPPLVASNSAVGQQIQQLILFKPVLLLHSALQFYLCGRGRATRRGNRKAIRFLRSRRFKACVAHGNRIDFPEFFQSISGAGLSSTAHGSDCQAGRGKRTGGSNEVLSFLHGDTGFKGFVTRWINIMGGHRI